MPRSPEPQMSKYDGEFSNQSARGIRRAAHGFDLTRILVGAELWITWICSDVESKSKTFIESDVFRSKQRGEANERLAKQAVTLKVWAN